MGFVVASKRLDLESRRYSAKFSLSQNSIVFPGKNFPASSTAEQEAEGRRKIPQKATHYFDPGNISALPKSLESSSINALGLMAKVYISFLTACARAPAGFN